MAAPRITVGTIVRVVILCFIVGLALTFFNVDPATVWVDLGHWARDSVRWMFDNLGTVFSYILLGAVIVLPIWGLVLLLRTIRDRR